MQLVVKLAGDTKQTKYDLPPGIDREDLIFKIEHHIPLDLGEAGKLATSHIQTYQIVD